jgi:dTDP-glucose 4,6-dehydratase
MYIAEHGEIGENYNIGANKELTNKQVIEIICSELEKNYPDYAPEKGYKSLIIHTPDRQGGDFRYAVDSTKLQGIG